MANARSWRGWTAKGRAGGSGSAAPLNDEVARVAYEIYERRGRINGYDWQDWFEAERVVKQRRERTTQSR